MFYLIFFFQGLHGRIPRKVILDEDNACTYCALNISLKSLENFMGQLETGKDTTNQVNPNAVATVITHAFYIHKQF